MKQTGYAYAYGAGTIINAISTWKGAAFGIDLKTEAEVILTDDKKIIGYMEEGGDTTLIERSVELTLSRFGSKTGAKVATKSRIPIASGLKSSSAATNATVLATLDALGEKLEPIEVIKIGVQAALDAKVTITGKLPIRNSLLTGLVVHDQFVDELAQEVIRLGAVETVDLGTATVGDDRRKAPYFVLAGDAHVLVGIHFGQQEFAAVFFRQLLQTRSQHVARRTPLCTDVEQDRRFLRTRDHALVKIGFFHFVRKGMGVVHVHGLSVPL